MDPQFPHDDSREDVVSLADYQHDVRELEDRASKLAHDNARLAEALRRLIAEVSVAGFKTQDAYRAIADARHVLSERTK